VYTARKVDFTGLRKVTQRLPASASNASRRAIVNDDLGAIAPKFVQLTNDVVFEDLWRRPDLTVRDRSLVTIAALAAMGDDDQLEGFVRHGIDSGVTQAQITEVLTQLGFYAGWPKAIAVVMRTLGKMTEGWEQPQETRR
jgi:4-carboxymuconolactone decarboxylase